MWDWLATLPAWYQMVFPFGIVANIVFILWRLSKKRIKISKEGVNIYDEKRGKK